jgi:hypothetical protein
MTLPVRSPATPFGVVAVTYDNERDSDGVGSQLQRIYGLYALSRGLNVKYVHTPLGRIGYQGLMPWLTGQLDPDYSERFNAFFWLPSDDFDIESAQRIRVHALNREVVEEHRRRAGRTGQPVLLCASLPFGYTDLEPSAYAVLRAVSPYRGHRPSGPFRVCVHLRRGDNSVSGRPDSAERLLPNDYYLRVCETLLERLRQQGEQFVVRMHTEVPPRAYTLDPGVPGKYFQLVETGTIDPAAFALEQFFALPNLELVVNAHAKAVIDDFATADVLVLARSSLGYVAGQLNPHGLVVYGPWWHPPLPGWLIADKQGNLDDSEVARRLHEHLRRRKAALSSAATVHA